MELNRRNFIMALVGGAAGIHLTPLPWKLMDDAAIWTQNWPWVPVPPVGKFAHVKSVCKLCPGGCGIEVRKVDERAVKIEGRTDYPVNPGGLCPLGMGGLQLLYNEGIRYTGPMKRVGPRGAGKYTDISWDEAVDLLASRILGLRKEGKPEAIAALDGNPLGSTMSVLIERLLRSVGSPNLVRTPSLEETYRMGNALMKGTKGPMAYDLENADYILSFGCGLLEGWGAPGRVLNAWGSWHEKTSKGGTKVVQIESRASNTASKADHWVAARPGTEAALALAMAHVIIKEGLFDGEFINNYCFGFEDWRSADSMSHKGFKSMVLGDYSPDQMAPVTGLAPKEIVSLARDFAGAKAPIAIYGKGKGTLNGSLYELMAVQGLNALVGNINKPGGVLVHDPLPLNPLPEPYLDNISREGLEKSRLDHAGSKDYPFTFSLIGNLAEAIMGEEESPVDTLLVFSANPVFTLPGSGAFKSALKKIPFIVSFSPFRDETSYMADLILPDHVYLEKMDEVVWPTGLQYPLYGLSKPVVEPLYNTRNTGDVLIQLAKEIGNSIAGNFPWESYADVLKLRAKGLFDAGGGMAAFDADSPVWELQKKGTNTGSGFDSFDDMYEKLKSGGFWYKPGHTYGGWSRLFKTPTGKFEFSSSKIELALKKRGTGEKTDAALMPHYQPVSSDADNSAYPLAMVPYEMINLASGWVPGPPYLNKTLFDHQLYKNESFAEFNPRTAAEYGLKEGDRVAIQSKSGEIRVRAHLFEGAMPGIVFLPLGFGHTAYDDFLRGKGANPNDIIDPEKEPLSGYPIWWRTPVKVTKV